MFEKIVTKLKDRYMESENFKKLNKIKLTWFNKLSLYEFLKSEELKNFLGISDQIHTHTAISSSNQTYMIYLQKKKP